ncbi:MAG: MFS family permease [Paracoccaceae bacterium]|jgi:MFS family permease
MPQADAGALWAWFGFLSIFSGVLFGAISDRIGRRAGMAAAFAVLASAYLLVGFGPWMPGLYASIALFGLAAWSIPVIMSAAAGDYFGPAAAAGALAALVLVFSAGQALGPVLAGLLADMTGDFSASHAAAGAAALAATGLIAALRPRADDAA